MKDVKVSGYTTKTKKEKLIKVYSVEWGNDESSDMFVYGAYDKEHLLKLLEKDGIVPDYYDGVKVKIRLVYPRDYEYVLGDNHIKIGEM